MLIRLPLIILLVVLEAFFKENGTMKFLKSLSIYTLPNFGFFARIVLSALTHIRQT